MATVLRLLSVAVALSAAPAGGSAADLPPVRYVAGAEADTAAAVVGAVPLVHTSQLVPVNKFGRLIGGTDAREQAAAVLAHLDEVLRQSGGDPRRVVKLNLTAATQAAADAALGEVRRHYPAWGRPPVTVAVGRLPGDGFLVAADAVAVGVEPAGRVTRVVCEGVGPAFGPHAATLPAGPRAYVSGQAEKGATPAAAAAATLASLKRTLDFLGAKPEDAVQAKCFLTPMTAADDVLKEFDKAFGPGRLPVVFVEWGSSLPVEIELIARCPAGPKTAGPVEYLTPPGMTTPTIYCRVARVNAPGQVFIGGLSSPKPGTGAEQVTAVFDTLKGLLAETGSDLTHLVKATYLVSDADASQKLNELRPKYYDPKRPPAASKATVAGVGRAGRSLTLDMIAVPTK